MQSSPEALPTTSSSPRGRRLRGLGIAALGLGFSVWAAVFIWRASFVTIDGQRRTCLFDDAMISLRYAWNLAHGNGLVWNPGERVEGITNFLWTLCMAVPVGLLDKTSAVFAVQILGLLLMLLIAWLTMRIGETLLEGTGHAGRPLLSVLFFAVPLLYYPLAFWALMGMETPLLTALLLGALLIALRRGDETRPLALFAVLLGLAFLTRPDAAVPVAIFLLYRLLRVRPRGAARAAVIEGVVIAIFAVGITLFRRLYYGEFLPNTFTLKVKGLSIADRLQNGLEFVGPYWRSIWIAAAIALVAVILNRSRRYALLLALPAAALAYQVWVGGEPWPYWRVMSPTVSLLFVLCIAEGARLVRLRVGKSRLARDGGPRLRAALPVLEGALVVGGLLGILHAANHDFEGEYLFREPAYFVKYNHKHVDIAIALDELVEPGGSAGLTWAGAIPYYTGMDGVDFLGKSDRHVASLAPVRGDTPGRFDRVPGHNKYDLAYSIVELQPTYIQTPAWEHQDVTDFVRRTYRGVTWKGVPLLLHRESPLVRWELLGLAAADAPSPGG